MERQRRDTEEENNLWANPCDYGSQTDKPNYTSDAKKIAWNLASQARNTFTKTESYKDTFALKLHSYNSFKDLLKSWDSDEYLPTEWLPKEKVLYEDMPKTDIDKLVKEDTFDTILPGMYKGLKMIVAGLYKLNEELNSNVISDESLKNNINKTMHDVRAVLCHFNDIMNLRNLKIEKLLDSEIPSLKNDMGVLLYRDTLRYLEYLEQVFLAFHERA